MMSERAQKVKKNRLRARFIGAGLGVLISTYCIYKVYQGYVNDPLNSIYDSIVRKIKGGPYRDYILIDPSSSELVDGPLYRHADSEIQFQFLLPNKFVRPGVVVRDNIDNRGVGGNMEMYDLFGNYLSVDWVKLQQYDMHKLQDGRGDVLLEQAMRVMKEDKSQGYQTIWKQRARRDESTGVPDVFFVVMENPNAYQFDKSDYFKGEVDKLTPSNSDVMGRVIFTRDNYEHLIVITTKYPNSMINFDILRQELIKSGLNKDEVDKKLSHYVPKAGDLNEDLFSEMCAHSTANKQQIIEELRNELISHILVNFKHGRAEIPK